MSWYVYDRENGQFCHFSQTGWLDGRGTKEDATAFSSEAAAKHVADWNISTGMASDLAVIERSGK